MESNNATLAFERDRNGGEGGGGNGGPIVGHPMPDGENNDPVADDEESASAS